MEAEKQKGVFHAGKSKSLSSGNAYENERRGWSEESYRLKNSNPITSSLSNLAVSNTIKGKKNWITFARNAAL